MKAIPPTPSDALARALLRASKALLNLSKHEAELQAIRAGWDGVFEEEYDERVAASDVGWDVQRRWDAMRTALSCDSITSHAQAYSTVLAPTVEDDR